MYTPRVSDAQPIGPIIETLLEDALFADPDPRVQRLRRMWEDSKRETQALFEKCDRENYEGCLDYHRTCGNPDAESAAKGEAWALRQLLIEEREERLGVMFSDVQMRLCRVLEDIEAERAGE